MLKVTPAATAAKVTPKYFVEGLPKDFTLETESNKARISGTLSNTTAGLKKTYALAAVPASPFDAAGLREVAEHFLELADLMDGKLKVA